MNRLVVALTLVGMIASGATTDRADAAEFFEKVGTFDGQFLKIPIGARATAMGAAFVAVADDASSIYWNSAGVARLSKNILSVNHTNWIADMNMTQVSYVFSLSFLPGMLAVDARSLYMDRMDRTTVYRPDGDGTTFDAGYASYGLTYARSLTDKFSVGLRASLITANLDDISATAVGFDIGTLYDTGFQSLKIGMQIANMGTELKFIDESRSGKLPILFRVGAAIDLYNSLDHRITTSGDFSHPPDNKERLNWGAEYGFKEFLFFRGGLNFGYDAETFAAGMGVIFPASVSTDMKFDYSYTDLGDLSGTHRFTLEIGF